MMLVFLLLPLLRAEYELKLNKAVTEPPDFTPCTNGSRLDFTCIAQAAIESMNTSYYVDVKLGEPGQELKLLFTTFDEVWFRLMVEYMGGQ